MILLVQLPVPFAGVQEVTGNIPVGPASLVACAGGFTGTDQASGGGTGLQVFDQAEASRLGDAALVDALSALSPDVVSFTLFSWNVERSLYVASELRSRLPGVFILFGGPEVARGSILYELATARPAAGGGRNAVARVSSSGPMTAVGPDLSRAPGSGEIDGVAVEGEGEIPFLRLVRSLGRRRRAVEAGRLETTLPGDEPSLRLLSMDNTGPGAELLLQPEAMCSPWTAGLLATERDGAMFAEWSRGCRYRCAFCRYHQGRWGASRTAATAARVSGELAWARKHGVKEIYVLDPSFESRPSLNELLDLLERENREPAIPLMVELRAEEVDDELAVRLARAGIRRVEAGLQSVNATTLAALGRSCRLEDFTRGTEALLRHGVSVKTDLMAGLPGEAPEDLEKAVRFLDERGLSQRLQVFVTQVLPGTILRDRAAELGLVFDDRPPYYIRSTPTWPEAELSSALARAEELLDCSFDVDREPMLAHVPEHGGPFAVENHPDARAAWHVYCDLGDRRGIDAIEACSFRDTAFTVTLRLAGLDPAASPRSLQAAERAVARLLENNPFCTVFVVVECAACQALDGFDVLAAALARLRKPTYGDRFFRPFTGLDRTMTRLVSMMDLDEWRRSPVQWRTALCEVSDPVVRVRCNHIDEAVERAASFVETTEGDGDESPDPQAPMLFLDLPDPGRALHPLLARRLLSTGADVSSVLLPGLEMEWAWRRIASSGEDRDW